ncbi:MAG: hypothetical protein R6W90_00740 [Ignavibacteriaceae bacterium]
MKKISILIFFIAAFTSSIYSQNINGRFSSSVYMFERYDTTDISNTYARAYQMLSLNINEGRFSLRSYLNLENDFSKDIEGDPRLRFYNLYLEGRNLLDLFTVKLGRQPLFTNVAGGLFDGVNVDVKYSGLKLTGYYGGNVPNYQKLEIAEDFDSNYVLGGKLTSNNIDNLQLSVSYIKKNFKPQSFLSISDETNDPISTLIQRNSYQYEFFTAEASYELKNLGNVDARFDYDVNYEQPSKYEINAQYNQIEDLSIEVYYNYREPRIKYNSIFSVFDYGNTSEIEAGGSYKINNMFTVSGRYGNVSYKDENSGRISLGVNSDYGSIFYRKSLGYAGELDAVSLYSAYTFLEGLLTPSLGLTFTDYKLSEESEKNNLISLLAGVNYRPLREISFDVQGQYMDNKIYKNDFRFFFKVNYWFNTNLN